METQVETQLVKYFAKDDDNLRADVLVVPHHGSRSSSSDEFVRAVSPEYALISTGYMNRYGLPKADIVAKYTTLGAQVLNTSHDGAISFLMDKSGLSELSLHRKVARHYWSSITN
jgi:competence protein ComEC